MFAYLTALPERLINAISFDKEWLRRDEGLSKDIQELNCKYLHLVLLATKPVLGDQAAVLL